MKKTDSQKTTIKIQTSVQNARTWTNQAKRLGISRNDFLLSLIDSGTLSVVNLTKSVLTE